MEQELPLFGLAIHHEGDVATVALRGELDLDGANDVRSAVAALLDLGVVRIDVDAAQLAFIDSAGVKALLDARHDAADRGVALEVVAASTRLRWVAQVTGVEGLVPDAE